jgi:hypothetical protein
VLAMASARALPVAAAPAPGAVRSGIGAVTLAAAGRPRDRMPEPCPPPCASAVAARHGSKRAMAGKSCRRGGGASMLTP